MIMQKMQNKVNDSLSSSMEKVEDDILVPDSENFDDQVEDREFLVYGYEEQISYEDADDNQDSVEKVEVEVFVKDPESLDKNV